MSTIDDLLAAERRAGDCTLRESPGGAAMHDRVWARTQASLPGLAPAPADPRAPAPRSAIPTLGIAVVLCAALGGALALSVIEREDRAPSSNANGSVATDAPASASLMPSPVAATDPEVGRPIAAADLPDAPRTADSAATRRPPRAPDSVKPAASRVVVDDLDRERRLLDRVRSSLANGDLVGAQEALTTHDTSFPDGQLGEEAEALRIRTLAAAGKGDVARARAAKFLERFPTSFFRPAIERALTSPPAAGGGP